jgi:translation initiation factor 6 (eIF-6)
MVVAVSPKKKRFTPHVGRFDTVGSGGIVVDDGGLYHVRTDTRVNRVQESIAGFIGSVLSGKIPISPLAQVSALL